MENLSKIVKRPLWLMTFFFVTHLAISQQELIVYKVKGEPYVSVNDTIMPISKGSVLNNETTLYMNRNDELHYIDSKGDIFELFETGKFEYVDLQGKTAFKDNTFFMKSLFSYVWKELSHKMASRNNKSGVVYRGDALVLMRHPADSIAIYKGGIRFEWEPIKDKEKDYFFMLRDMATGAITTIGTPATSLYLTVDGGLLKAGHQYEWTITENKFQNLNKASFYSFKMLTQDEFKERATEIKEISVSLKKLGFSKSEIREAICQDYKICY